MDNTQIHNNIVYNFPFYAENCLQIKDKEGNIVPFRLNKEQRYIHTLLEKQKKEMGYIRALILKGRQQGCSTYVGGRYYHKASTRKGKSVFILSHHAQTTKKLFDMTKRFYKKSPEAIQPSVSTENRNQLVFDRLESEYSIGTAGYGDVGRGGTVQYFHGSEVAFWENAADIQTGVLQSIADVPGTEIILESTAKGVDNIFYRMCMNAMGGKGKYILIFIPWYWHTTYRTPVRRPNEFTLTDQERELVELYNLDNEQLQWRRDKIVELGDEWKFKQEYPNNPQEAFQSGTDSEINPSDILKARKRNIAESSLSAPLVVGVDPARSGDRCCISYRRGRKWIRYETYPHQEHMQMYMAGVIANIIEKLSPQKVFIDPAQGTGTYDRLCELGYSKVVHLVYFSEGALFPDEFLNKRAEMIRSAAEWFKEEVDVPDDDALHADCMATPRYQETSNGKKFYAPKDKIKKDFGKSPDIFDSFILTFAYPVRNNKIGGTLRKSKVSNNSGSKLQSLNLFSGSRR